MEIFWYNIQNFNDKLYKDAFNLLDKDRKKRVRKMSGEDDQKRTVAGEWLVRTNIGEKLHMEPGKIELLRDEQDKPYIKSCPYSFSVSHSGDYVVCAIDNNPIGIDIEKMKNVDEKFIARVCSEDEQRFVRFPFGGYNKRFWECWTAKEALFKLTGEGSLLSQSKFALSAHQVVDFYEKEGYALSIARVLSH